MRRRPARRLPHRLSVAVDRRRAFARPAAAVVVLGLFTLSAPAYGESRRGHFTHLDGSDGLPNSVVRRVLQDEEGFIWLGTQNGLARFDGFRFETYAHDPEDPGTLSGSYIVSLVEDSRGDLWIGTYSNGLNRLSRGTEVFTRYRHQPENPASLGHDSVLAIHEGSDGMLWLGTGHGVDRYDPASGLFKHYRYEPGDAKSHLYDQVWALGEDHLGVIWVGTQGGLGRLDRESGRIVIARQSAVELGQVSSLLVDRRGEIWIGAEGGLFRWDRQQQEVVAAGLPTGFEDSTDRIADEVVALHQDHQGFLWMSTGRSVIGVDLESRSVVSRYRAGEANSLLGDYVWDIAQDRSGAFWFATRSGISRMAPRHQVFRHYRLDIAGRRLGNVASLREDRFGDLWVGTWAQGLHRFGPTAELKGHYRHDSEDPASLSNDWVWTIYEDSRGDLWIGTNAGLDRLDRSRDAFISFRPRSGGPASFGPGGVGGIIEDPAGDLWVAKSSHLSRLDPRTGRLIQYVPDPADPTGLGGQDLLSLYIDGRGDLWIGSDGDGLLRFERESESFQRFHNDPGDPSSLSHDQASSIYEDAAGTLWIGTLGGGVNRLLARSGVFHSVRKRDGLPSDWITGIQGDERGNLWIGTDMGLARFEPASGEIHVYDAADGALTGFSARAHARGRGGALFFGGSQDLIAFFPDDIGKVEQAPTVFITGVRTFGSESSDKGRRPDLLPRPVRRGGAAVVLSPEEYLFSIEFAALEFSNPEKVRFQYQLEGFDSGWIPADASQPLAQFSRVDPGSYTFRVKAANRYGVWDEPGASIPVTVLPTFWQTWWAYGLYSLATAGLVLAFALSQRSKVAYERAASARLRHLDKLKDEFLANTSHELRTPLYGMTGLAESLIDGARGKLPEGARSDLSMLVSSGRRLSALVDDILDFSRLREKSLELHRQPVDLHSLAEVVLALLRPLKASKELELRNNVPADLPPADADESRLQQILYNLIGNAIKFSEAGTIEVAAAVEDGRIAVRVTDQGIGIPEAMQTRIFEAFEQADASTQRQFGGTGLGLALTRQLVELHGGSLGLTSAVGRGSTFFFTLPRAPGEATAPREKPERRGPPPGEAAAAMPTVEAPLELEPEEKPLAGGRRGRLDTHASVSILIVDDEPVNRQVLVNHLTAQHFRVVQAAGGRQALRWLDRQTFDLVLLDVMMPKMSGFEVCRRIRDRFSMQQLPVIFLTAKNQTSDLVAGMDVGANDYLTKPVPKDELLSRVRTHLDLLFIHRDLEGVIDERGQLIAERDRLIEELKTRNAELARFNHAIAHDLSNPLTTIKNYLGLAHRDAGQGDIEQLERDLARVDLAADRLRRQLDDLFEISRLSHRIERPQVVPLGEVAREASKLLAESVAEHGVVVEMARRLPVVRGDRARLVKVFWHLLANALKSLGDQAAPRIEIGSRLEEKEEIVYVRDNGRGIDPRYHQRVFEVFEQLDAGEEGTGAGLALVRRIIDVQGGRIWVESEGAGHGSTFCFTLPAATPAPSVDEQ